MEKMLVRCFDIIFKTQDAELYLRGNKTFIPNTVTQTWNRNQITLYELWGKNWHNLIINLELYQVITQTTPLLEGGVGVD